MEYTDVELIERCILGDKFSFEELINRYKKLIFSVVYNMLSDKQDVNDVAQEVFIRIYKNLDKYNKEFKFSTWSVKIATNLCLDILRKKKLEYVPIEEIEGISISTDTPESKFIKNEKSNRIKKVIEALPEKYKVPIVLYHQNGLSYQEMANILNEPITIIKNRLYRARLILREKLSYDREEGLL